MPTYEFIYAWELTKIIFIFQDEDTQQHNVYCELAVFTWLISRLLYNFR